MLRAQHGDARAFEQLVEPYREIAFRVAYLITRNGADAEDATQDALEKAWRALARFRPDAPLRPWLLRIAANEARNRRRSTGRREGLVLRAAAPPRLARAAARRITARSRVPVPARALGGGDRGRTRRAPGHGEVALRESARPAEGGAWTGSSVS